MGPLKEKRRGSSCAPLLHSEPPSVSPAAPAALARRYSSAPTSARPPPATAIWRGGGRGRGGRQELGTQSGRGHASRKQHPSPLSPQGNLEENAPPPWPSGIQCTPTTIERMANEGKGGIGPGRRSPDLPRHFRPPPPPPQVGRSLPRGQGGGGEAGGSERAGSACAEGDSCRTMRRWEGGERAGK